MEVTWKIIRRCRQIYVKNGKKRVLAHIRMEFGGLLPRSSPLLCFLVNLDFARHVAYT